MILKRLLIPACAAAAAAVAVPRVAARADDAYKGAIATDALTGAVLFENNADAVSPPASMTKLMTFAVLDDMLKQGSIRLDTPVTVTPETARVAMYRKSTNVWLRQGETFSVEELMYAMMIQSANDAAYALAQKASGSADAFVVLMNEKAREIGMTRTTYRSPHGYPPPSRRISDGDLTTPRDYSLLCRYLLLNTNILRFSSVKTRAFGLGVRSNPVVMTNHNHLLGAIPGVDGLKTGFTDGAGFCLSATALRGGHRVIVVMMDSPDSKTRDLNMEELIDRAFAKIPFTEAPFSAAQAQVPAPGGRSTPTRPAPEPAPAAPTGSSMVRYPGLGGR